jgi:IS30 family transposase
MHRQCCTQKQIAEAIGKDKSVVSRELKRNANSKDKYSFEYAQDMANLRKVRMQKPSKLHSWLKKEITGLIEQDWSPQQIAGRLKMENKPFVSHETIYKIIRKDKTEGGMLYKHIRHSLKRRKRLVGKKTAIKNRISIDQRPEIVDTKQRFGDWKTDTIVGENNKGAPDFVNTTPYRTFSQNIASNRRAIALCFSVRSMVFVSVSLLCCNFTFTVVIVFAIDNILSTLNLIPLILSIRSNSL